MNIRKFVYLLPFLALLIVSGCATAPSGGPPPVQEQEIAALTRAISSLGSDVDPDEAARAARISYEYAQQLAIEYQITDPPIIHNMKVNMGLRPRGLCYHWADDIEKRLGKENFRTLSLHRAIANANRTFAIEHSSVIVSRSGDTMFQGVVLDGWRNGGVLYWTPTLEDPRYEWVPREIVFREKRRIKNARARWSSSGDTS